MRSRFPRGWLTAALIAVAVGAACTQQLPPRSALDLMEDPVTLQGVLLRCNQLQTAALRDQECRNAREAVERLANENEGSQEAQAQAARDKAAFERAREARRARDEQQRLREQDREQRANDPYKLPLDFNTQSVNPQTTAGIANAPLPPS
jgi:hypothetical protein